MSIAFVGSGGLFTRLGKLNKALADINSFQKTTLRTDVTNIENQFTGNLYLIDGLEPQLTSAQQSAGSLTSFLSQLWTGSINDAVFIDNPQLSNSDIFTSLREMVRQMKSQNFKVARCDCAITSAATGTNQGNGVIVGSVKGQDGLVEENLIAETLTGLCVQDQNDNSSVVNNESFEITGQFAYDAFDWHYPGGSASDVTVSVINPRANNNSGNLLNNSSFDTYTSPNVPDNWNIAVGTAGTTVKKSTTTVFAGSGSLQFVASGTELTKVQQTLNVGASGSAGQLAALNQYAFNCWLRTDINNASGALQIALVDGNNTVTADYQGVLNSATQQIGSLTLNTWTAFNGVFRTPQVMPTTFKVQVGLTSSLASGNLFIDQLALGSMDQLYQGGPSVAMFAGSTPFYDNDRFLITTTNNRASASTTLATWQTAFDRFLDMKGLNLLLPSATGSPNVADGLLT